MGYIVDDGKVGTPARGRPLGRRSRNYRHQSSSATRTSCDRVNNSLMVVARPRTWEQLDADSATESTGHRRRPGNPENAVISGTRYPVG